MLQDISLNGEWQFFQAGVNEKLTGVVPGSVYGDLLALKRIPDPNWRTNELESQWVGKVDWTYQRDFDVSAETLAQEHIILRAEGLDTLATVRLNGQEIGRADNMHRTWEWDVKAALKTGANHLEIFFPSCLPFLEEKAKINPLNAWNEYLGWKHRGWIRKQHSNFGWDWGNVAVSSGIWRNIGLLAWSGARLNSVRVDQHHTWQKVEIVAHPEIIGEASATRLAVEIFLGEGKVAEAESAAGAPVSITLENPELWWPNELGAQPLYRVVARLLDGGGQELDRWERRIGLRTMNLIRKPDEFGETFYFEVNGEPFFAKGGNWINPLTQPNWPADGSWLQYLKDSVTAHHNFVRMWGGAYFFPDEFFDACDELGLAVWQDFLFACGPYPGFDPAFVENVQAEARDNIRRMRHHASMALWCGNNELESFFYGPETTPGKMSFAEYDRIFNGVLKDAVAELDPQRSYWPASPSCTSADRMEVTPGSGDTHAWALWFADAPFENIRDVQNRFISEFGFQSMPDYRTIESFTLPEDRQFNSPVLEHHQRSQPGNAQQMKTMLEWFRMPLTFRDQVDLGQLVQAICNKVGVEHWRRSMPRTMGALYWQINDCWPAPTWSSIDFMGRWKALHHFTARFFAPVLISGLEDKAKGTLEIHVTNDRLHEVRGTARWLVMGLEGNVVQHGDWQTCLPKTSSTRLTTLDLSHHLKTHGASQLFVWFAFDGGDGNHSSNIAIFDRPKRLELREPGLSYELSEGGDGTIEITVSAQKPAPWVWLDTGTLDLRLSNNFFTVLPEQPVKVIATPVHGASIQSVEHQLKLRHIRQTYVAPVG